MLWNKLETIQVILILFSIEWTRLAISQGENNFSFSQIVTKNNIG
ncbi:MAG: hypothetical protein R2680_10740 [Nitrososphaeraceae archaeon]